MASIKLIDKNGGIVSAFQDAQTRHFIKGNDLQVILSEVFLQELEILLIMK